MTTNRLLIGIKQALTNWPPMEEVVLGGLLASIAVKSITWKYLLYLIFTYFIINPVRKGEPLIPPSIRS